LGIILYEIIYKKYPFPVDSTGYVDRLVVENYFDKKTYNISYPMITEFKPIIKLLPLMLERKPM